MLIKEKILSSIRYLKEITGNFSNIFFEQPQKNIPSFLTGFYIIVLYVVGVFFWGGFFNWGNVNLDFHDWADINMPRLEIINDAFFYQMIPIHAECGQCLHSVTDRFLVLPDVITTPQMVLLLFVPIQVFVLVDILFHYSLATIGILLLRKRFNLSLVSYTFLFLTFQFNGYIQSHYAVGHVTWSGYFLFPIFFELIFQLLDSGPNWGWVGKVTLLAFYTVLAGSQHHFTWMMLFLAVLALSYRVAFKWIGAAIIFSGFVSAIRLLPPALGINRFSYYFFGVPGYQTIYDFLTALVSLNGPKYQFESWPYDIGYWEFDYYLGFAGTALLIYFGIVNWLKFWNNGKIHSALIFPTFMLFLFSQSSIYSKTLYMIPLFASERIASRMISLPITLVLIISAIYLNDELKIKNIPFRFLIFASMLSMLNDLFIHRSLWEIESISKNFAPVILSFSGNSIINHQDHQYFLVLYLGLGISSVFAFLLSMLIAIEKKYLGK